MDNFRRATRKVGRTQDWLPEGESEMSRQTHQGLLGTHCPFLDANSCLLLDDQRLEDGGLRGDQGPTLHAGESPAASGPLEAQPHVSDPHLVLRGLAVTSPFSCLQGAWGPRLV